MARCEDVAELSATQRVEEIRIGLPWQVVIGPNGVAGDYVEMKNRATGERQEISASAALARLTA